MLPVDIVNIKSEFYLHTMEQMLVAAGAGRTITLSKPAESLLAKRMAACVQLHDSAGEWQGSDERSKVWIEYLCTADLEQDVLESTPRRAGAVSRSSSTLGGPWFGEALAMGYKELRHLAKSFHTRGKRVAEETHDKFHKDAVSIEFGYSTYVGGRSSKCKHGKMGKHTSALQPQLRAISHSASLWSGPRIWRGTLSCGAIPQFPRRCWTPLVSTASMGLASAR